MEEIFDDLLTGGGGHVGVGEGVAQLVVGLESLGKAQDLVVGSGVALGS